MPHLTGLEVDFVSLVDRAAVRDPVNQAEPMRFLVWKRDQHHTPHGGTMTPEEKAALDKAQADLKKAEERAVAAEAKAVKADEQIATLTKSVDELKKAADPEAQRKAEEEALKKEDLPEPVRKALEKAEADKVALTARLEKAEEATKAADDVAKAERETRLTREFVTKAEGYKALSLKPAEFGPVLKSASEKLTKDEYDELDRVLKAADAALNEAGIFDEQGRSREAATPDSALAEATAKAEEIRKADPKITPTQALDMALTADRGLQERYLAEQR